MKNLFRISILAVAASIAAHAQSSSFRVTVPFDFIVGKQTLPAGHYTIGVQVTNRIVSINCLDHAGNAGVVGQAISVPGDNTVRLVFHRYASTYFLAQAWPLAGYGRALPKTKREHELSAQNSMPDTVTITASR